MGVTFYHYFIVHFMKIPIKGDRGGYFLPLFYRIFYGTGGKIMLYVSYFLPLFCSTFYVTLLI